MLRYNDDDFNYNHGIALAATRNYKAAEEALLLIHNVCATQQNSILLFSALFTSAMCGS